MPKDKRARRPPASARSLDPPGCLKTTSLRLSAPTPHTFLAHMAQSGCGRNDVHRSHALKTPRRVGQDIVPSFLSHLKKSQTNGNSPSATRSRADQIGAGGKLTGTD